MALVGGLISHTGSKSAHEMVFKVVFVLGMCVDFIYCLLNYDDIWEVIFATAWYAIFPAAIALIAALFTSVIAALAKAFKWITQGNE